jgi:hypothetical protein
MNAQQKIDAQVLELHLLIANEIERRPDEAMAYAQQTLRAGSPRMAITPITGNGQAYSIRARPLSLR